MDRAQATHPQRNELSVSELTRLVKELLESDPRLGAIWVRGEASNVRLAGSGHLYFTLKDAAAQLRVAFFGFGRGKRQPPAEGEALLVHGDIRVYERSGEYQLVADDLLRAGVGDLAAQFEALKRKLADEGLFDESRKLPRPALPRRIAIVTSLTTAALRDVLNILKRRAPYLEAVVFHASVQGEAAPAELVAALHAAEACPGIELILLVRGGGSIEDLWCFNDEALARVQAGLRVPVISGVGHEIDFTIADFVADQRAPTPSAAAELAAPDTAELRSTLTNLERRCLRSTQLELQQVDSALQRLFDRRLLRDVAGAVETRAQALDQLSLRLAAAAAQRARLGTAAEAPLLAALAAPVLRRLDDLGFRLPHQPELLLRALRLRLEELAAQLKARSAELSARDPEAPKKLGFALVWATETGQLVRDQAQVPPGSRLRIEVRDGEFAARREVDAANA